MKMKAVLFSEMWEHTPTTQNKKPKYHQLEHAFIHTIQTTAP